MGVGENIVCVSVSGVGIGESIGGCECGVGVGENIVSVSGVGVGENIDGCECGVGVGENIGECGVVCGK